MTGPSQGRVLALFERLCDSPPEAVQAVLAGEAPAVRAAVRRMLEADQGGGALDDSLAFALAMDALLQGSGGLQEPQVPTLPGYRILSRLGAGGMGVVFEAEQLAPQRHVAIKVLRPSSLSARAVDEAQALADVAHPSVPHLIEVGEVEGQSYLVMERVFGVPLTQWGQGRSLRDKVRVFSVVCRGVEAAHEAGLLHCDLKPANILVQADGQPRILDFGIARSLQARSSGHVGGTLPYMADELLLGGLPNRRSEVYALGVVLYELICGERPFLVDGGCSTDELLEARAKGLETPIFENPEVPEGLAAVLTRALEPAPEARYASAQDLVQELGRFLAERPVQAHPGGLLYPLRLWGRRRRRPLRVLGGLLTLAGLVGLGAWGRGTLHTLEKERASEQRLKAATTHLDLLWQQGAREEAHALVQGFALVPDNLQTHAAGHLWLRLAEHLDGTPEARSAWVQVYTTGAEPERRRAAQALLEGAVYAGEWFVAEQILDGLPPGLLSAPEQADYRQQVAAALRDLDGAAAAAPESGVAPMLEALRGARRTPYRPIRVQEVPGGLVVVQQDRSELLLVETSPALPILSQVSLEQMSWGREQPYVLQEDPLLLSGVGEDGPKDWRVWAVDWEREVLVERQQRTFIGEVGPLARADTRGDGVQRGYLATVWPRAQVFEVDLETLETTLLHPGVPFLQAVVEGLAAADLDGDGAAELVLGLSEGTERGVRVVGWERGEPRERAAIERPGPWMPVSWAREGAADQLWALGGQQEGTRSAQLLSLSGEVLRPEWVRQTGLSSVTFGEPVFGDFDGDGLQDIALRARGTPHHTWLLRALPEGGFAGIFLSQCLPLAAAQLDGDGADELLVRLPDDDHHLWVLGLDGQGSMPEVTKEPLTAPVELPGEGAMAQARALVELGLVADAAAVLERMAPKEWDPARAAVLYVAASRLRRSQGAYRQAAAALYQAEERQPGVPAIRRELIEVLEADHRLAESAALQGAQGPAMQRLDGAGLLAASAALLAPEALSVGGEGSLRVDALSQDGLLLDLPLRVQGAHLGLEVEIDIHYAEPGVELEWVLIDAAGDPAARLSLVPWGAAGAVDRALRCSARGVLHESTPYRPRAEVRYSQSARLRLDLLDGEALCDLEIAGEQSRVLKQGLSLPEGDYRLQLRARQPQAHYEACRIQAEVHGLSLSGGVFVPPEHPPEAWAVDWVMGRLDQAMVDSPSPTLLAQAGRVDAILNQGPLDPVAHRTMLVRGLRTLPEVWIPILLAWDPELLSELYTAAWLMPARLSTTGDALATLEHPAVDYLAVATPRQLQLQARRAEIMVEQGQADRALALLDRLLEGQELRDFDRRRLLYIQAAVLSARGESKDEVCARARALQVQAPIFVDLAEESGGDHCRVP